MIRVFDWSAYGWAKKWFGMIDGARTPYDQSDEAVFLEQSHVVMKGCEGGHLRDMEWSGVG